MSAPTVQHDTTVSVGQDWVRQAACRTADPREFAPTIATSRSPQYFRERDEREATARRWCASCPVLTTCARAADANSEEGVWGGSLRRKDYHLGRYVADQLIPGAPASRRTRNHGEVAS